MIENRDTNSNEENKDENSGDDIKSFRNSSYDQNSQFSASMEQAMQKLSISAIQNSENNDSENEQPPAKELSTIIETKKTNELSTIIETKVCKKSKN